MLRDFIARAHPDDTCELAGLNYWAYWVGELDHPQRDDTFMVNTWPWRGGRLLQHLASRLDDHHAFVDLNVHTLWALMAARRDLVPENPDLGLSVLDSTERLLEQGEVSPQSRHELASIIYGLRMMGLTTRGRADERR